jgi:hypothetical protein
VYAMPTEIKVINGYIVSTARSVLPCRPLGYEKLIYVMNMNKNAEKNSLCHFIK